MQTFLPYESFSECARVLDNKRLNSQINEALIILRTITGWYAAQGRKGWASHPATKMWRETPSSLATYALHMLDEWKARGNKDKASREAAILYQVCLLHDHDQDPPWLSREDLHISHRRALLYKDPDHYRQFWPNLEPAVPDSKGRLPYVWPV
jgi:hypothetical protein